METGQLHLVPAHQGLRSDAGLPQQQEDVGSQLELSPGKVENRKDQRTSWKTGRGLRDGDMLVTSHCVFFFCL